MKKNTVFIAKSMDGFIADRNGGMDWLQITPNPRGNDMGYQFFLDEMDAIVMGRKSYETILGFDIDWPYNIPVFVLSSTLTEVPSELQGKVHFANGQLKEILAGIHEHGFHNLYIDGGITIQNFLKEDLINELIITTIPILLGGGIPLFGDLSVPIRFQCTGTKIFLDAVVQNHFVKLKVE
ncbi:MAG: dihydrofolate reductase family protein [Crocinitomicaceae bacterium]